jgi:hypothetical protein
LKICAFLLVASAALSAADSAIVGAWNLRIDRSEMRPTQILTEHAVISQKDGVTWHYVYDFEYKDGRKTHSETDRFFDGKERPTANGRVEVGRHPDAFNWISQQFTDGPDGRKLVSEIHSNISADGKTQTVRRTTVTAGETIKETIVFERQ